MMKPLVALLVVATSFVCGNGRLILDDTVFFRDDDQLDQNAYDADDDDSFHLETGEMNADVPFFDESLENVMDKSFDEQYFADFNVFEENDLKGCHNGKCEMCMKLWKLKGCFIVEITSEGIKASFKAFGHTFSQVMESNKSFTIKIKRSILPKSLRKLMKSDIEIKISGVNIARRQVCVQLKFKVKFLGTMKWPRRRPHCFKL